MNLDRFPFRGGCTSSTILEDTAFWPGGIFYEKARKPRKRPRIVPTAPKGGKAGKYSQGGDFDLGQPKAKRPRVRSNPAVKQGDQINVKALMQHHTRSIPR